LGEGEGSHRRCDMGDILHDGAGEAHGPRSKLGVGDIIPVRRLDRATAGFALRVVLPGKTFEDDAARSPARRANYGASCSPDRASGPVRQTARSGSCRCWYSSHQYP
jgi:hypothetical protein